MTTQYDTDYLNSLTIEELRELQLKIAKMLFSRYGGAEYEARFKEAITELAKTVGVGVIFS